MYTKSKSHKAIRVGLLAVVGLLCSSCIVVFSWVGNASGHSVLVVGDTITYDGYSDLKASLEADYYLKVLTGTGGYQITDMYSSVVQNINPPSDVVVINLGTYDALYANDPVITGLRWTNIRGFFTASPCIVAVTVNSHATTPGYSNAAATAINDNIRTYNSGHIVDWDAMVAGNPALIGPDGWSPAPDAYDDLAASIRQAVDDCYSAPPA